MSKVFVIQDDPKKNILPAMDFGELVYLLPHGQIGEVTDVVVDNMANKLDGFNSEQDTLLLIGDPTLIGIASALVSHVTNGYFSVLKWDRIDKRYTKIELDLGLV